MNSKFSILVVDDDLKTIQVGINILKENENYHLVFATSGEQALERVQETNFDLVLLDILMPTMDGYQICKRLKSDDKTKHIPVIFLTAKHDNESLVKGFEVGGADYITKPFNALELHARVKTHLDLHYYFQHEIEKLKKMLVFSQNAETIKFITGGIAHDCRNFMATISSSIFLLEKRMKDNGLQMEDYAHLIEGTKAASKNVLDMLQRFFSFTCKNEIVREVVDLKDVLSDLKKVYKDHLRHGIRFDTAILHSPALVYADKLHVEQVLLNILINGQYAILEQLPEKSDDGKILLTVDKFDGRIHKDLDDSTSYLGITVEDNGIGMTPETMGKIFDLYFTTRKNTGGSGLGLAISLNIVESYNGTIAVVSEPGNGSRFTIYLPCHTDGEKVD
jgi:signal transduction histidine kinase